MTLTASPASYSLDSSLTNKTEDSVSSRLRVCSPGEAAREQLIAAKLGVNGWGRWQYFKSFFSGAWGEGNQRPLSPRSQDNLFKALALLDFPEAAKPSLFLTDEGHCELAWRDADGKAIQMEFGPNEFEIYIESLGLEESFPSQQLPEVISRHF